MQEPALDSFEEDAPAPQKSFVRHPVVLVATLLGALFLLWKSWPSVEYLLTHQTPDDCGNISERPFLNPQVPLEHDRYCTMQGTVQSLAVLSSGGSDDPNPIKANKGRKYYVKLDGDRIFAVLDANDHAVTSWHLHKGNLLGFQVTGPGRIIDPQKDPHSAAIADQLRRSFAIPQSDPIRIYDTFDRPWDRWPKLCICLLMVLTILLTSYLLIRQLAFKKR